MTKKLTDRQLLEYAAKAAGKDLSRYEWYKTPSNPDEFGYISLQGDATNVWNPLRFDGDALRLAVRLGISCREPVRICIEFQGNGEPDFTCAEFRAEYTQYHDDNPYSATRRAIVSAAADYGRMMP